MQIKITLACSKNRIFCLLQWNFRCFLPYIVLKIAREIIYFVEVDKVRMYEEMMTNDDNNVESSLLTSNLLKIRSLYKFLLQVAHVEPAPVKK